MLRLDKTDCHQSQDDTKRTGARRFVSATGFAACLAHQIFWAMSLCAVRCSCGREIQSSYTRYRELQKQGMSHKDALDRCGLPTCAPFGSVEDSRAAPTPPPVCCRGVLLATIDLTARHNVLERIVRWAEGPQRSGSGTAPSSAPSKNPPH
jgi:DNA-directed RNA polymerase subunit N (RpoN/RPB10)